MYLFFLILFVLSAVINVMGHYLQHKKMVFYSKPLLMPLLFLFYFALAKQNQVPLHPYLTAGLALGWLGDLFLLFGAFLPGLFSFLLGHISYIILALQHLKGADFRPIQVIMAVFFSLIFFGVMKILKPGAGKLFPAVVAYGAVITGMLYSMSLLVLYQESRYLLCFVGACLFALSDTILGKKYFDKSTVKREVGVMATYILAQSFIVVGFLSGMMG